MSRSCHGAFKLGWECKPCHSPVPLSGELSCSFPDAWRSCTVVSFMCYLLFQIVTFFLCLRTERLLPGPSVLSLPHCFSKCWGGDSFVTMSASLLPLSCYSVFGYSTVVQSALSSSGGIILSAGVIWYSLWRRWVQSLPMLLSWTRPTFLFRLLATCYFLPVQGATGHCMAGGGGSNFIFLLFSWFSVLQQDYWHAFITPVTIFVVLMLMPSRYLLYYNSNRPFRTTVGMFQQIFLHCK